MIHRRIFWMAFWAATGRVLLLTPAVLFEVLEWHSTTLDRMYGSLFWFELWIYYKQRPVMASVPEWGKIALFLLMTWAMTFVIVAVVLEIAALFVRPKP